jgi:hypothetical protein
MVAYSCGLRCRVLIEALRRVEGAPCKSAQRVSLLCDALRLQHVAHIRHFGRAWSFGHTLDIGGVVHSVVSDARCPLITSMVQLGLGKPKPFDYSGEASSWLSP